jgi:hypothetical protein
VSTELWSAPAPFVPDEWRELVLEAIGTRLRVLLDGTVLVDLHDTAHHRGAVALHGGAGAQFAAPTVTAAEPVWMPYHTFTADGPIVAGRRVRLFAGTPDSALTPQTAEIHQFQGFAATDPLARRLPAEGVDLRLLSPDGEPVQANRFIPDSAYTPTPVTLLRSADGTGLIVLPPNASPLTGNYRFNWTYRRDNRPTAPTSPLLRESTDTTPETVSITIPLP